MSNTLPYDDRIVLWKEEWDKATWKPIKVKDLPEAIKAGAMFVTNNQFGAMPMRASEEKADLFSNAVHRWGDLTLDFDHLQDPGQALADMQRLVTMLRDDHLVNDMQLRFYFSGWKGVHCDIPAVILGAEEGDPLLPMIYKELLNRLGGKSNYPTLDMSLFCMGYGRQYRLPNVRRSNGRHKIPLIEIEVNDDYGISIDEMKALAETPREEERVQSPKRSESLAALYQECREHVYRMVQGQKDRIASGLTDEQKALLATRELRPCLHHALQIEDYPAGVDLNYNKLCFAVLVPAFKSMGYDLDEALEIGKDFFDNFSGSETYNSPAERITHFKDQWAVSGYEFVCGITRRLAGYNGEGCQDCPVGLAEINSAFNLLEESEDHNSHNSQSAADVCPVLDRTALPGIVGDFVDLATKDSEAHPAAVLATFLTRFGCEAFNTSTSSPFVQIAETKHYPRLSTAIVGASSKARKGTSAAPVERIFNLNPPPVTDDDNLIGHSGCATTPGPMSSGEGLVFAVRDPVEEYKRPKKGFDGGMVLTDPGVTDKRLYVEEQEFAAPLNCTKREGNTLSTIIRCLWDSGSVSPLTKNNRIKTTGAHVGIVAHITQAELSTTLNVVEMLNGFGNRFLWVHVNRLKLVSRPSKMPSEAVAQLQIKLMELLDLARGRGEISMSMAALELWDKGYPELAKERPGVLGAVLNRAEAQVIRLSLIYALLDGADQIAPTHLTAALAFWDYCERSASKIFQGRGDPLEEKVLAALCGAPKSKTDLHAALGRHVKAEQLGEVLNRLAKDGRVFVTTRPGPSGGPPKSIYTLRSAN